MPVKQQVWSFDPAHPAMAEQHYLRTADQNETLKQIAVRNQQDEVRAGAKQAQHAPHARLHPGGATGGCGSTTNSSRPATAASKAAPPSAAAPPAKPRPVGRWRLSCCPDAGTVKAAAAASGRSSLTQEECEYVFGLERRVDMLQRSLELMQTRQQGRAGEEGVAVAPGGKGAAVRQSAPSAKAAEHKRRGQREESEETSSEPGEEERRQQRQHNTVHTEEEEEDQEQEADERHQHQQHQHRQSAQSPPPVDRDRELQLACAAFDPARFNEFNRETDADMRRRRARGLARARALAARRQGAPRGGGGAADSCDAADSSDAGSDPGPEDLEEFHAGYDSDLEREEAAMEAAKSAGQRAAEIENRRRQAARDEAAARQVRRWNDG